MFVPNGLTEDEVLCTIEIVVKKLASPFRFGFHDADDMKQEGRIFAMEALPRFDASLGTLQVFLTNHVRNRFINMKRNKFERQQPPCSSCPFCDIARNECGAFDVREDCDKWQGWKKRNLVKRNLMEGYNPHDVVENSDDSKKNPTDPLSDMATKEIVSFVDKNIPVGMRADYCRMLSGVKISKVRRDRVIQTVRELIQERFIDE